MNDLWSRTNRILELLSPIAIDSEHVVRYGSTHDGGYLILDDLCNSDFLISMGIANDVNFEKAISSKVGGMHLYDDSISRPPEVLPNSVFYKERIGGDGLTTIQQAIERAPSNSSLVLKVDIEGSEWEAFSSAEPWVFDKFRQIVVEFHGLENIGDSSFFFTVIQVLEKLDRSHLVLNSHPNNWGEIFLIDNLILPQVIEITYLRRSDYEPLLQKQDRNPTIMELNAPCNPNKPEIYLQVPSIRFPGNVGSSKNKFLSWRMFDELTQQRDELTQQRDELTQQRDELTQQRDTLLNSTIWRLTKPLRYLINHLKR